MAGPQRLQTIWTPPSTTVSIPNSLPLNPHRFEINAIELHPVVFSLLQLRPLSFRASQKDNKSDLHVL